MAPTRFATSLPPMPPAEGGAPALDVRNEPRARRFVLLLLGVNLAVMALALGAGALAPAAEAAGHAGGDFIAWCSTLR